MGTLPVFAHKRPVVLVRSTSKKLLRRVSANLNQRPSPLLGPQVERLLMKAIVHPPLVVSVPPVVEVKSLQMSLRGNGVFAQDVGRGALRRWIAFPGKATIDAVIFDMDGTLLDSLPAWQHSASNFLRSQGIEPPAGIDDEMSKLSLLEGAQIIKERYGFEQSAEEILAATLAPIWEHYRVDIEAKPGALALLKSLHAQGIKISVATASHKELAREAFDRLGMSPYIDFIVTCDEVGLGKQSPAVYDAALHQMGTKKERTLVVEDALYALQTAKQAGYLTAGVEEPFHSLEHNYHVSLTGDYFIRSFLDGWVLLR